MNEEKKGFNFLRWLDNLPWYGLLIVAVMLGLAPVVPEPHLLEKVRMLVQGVLSKPLDIFDLLMHATPLLLVGVKSHRQLQKSRAS